MRNLIVIIPLICRLFLTSCSEKEASDQEDADMASPASWQKALSEKDNNDLSSALEDITDSMVLLKLSGEKIGVTVELEKYIYHEGVDDAVELNFKRTDHLEHPAYLDVTLKGSEATLNKIGFRQSKVVFARDQSETQLLIPIVDDNLADENIELRLTLNPPAFVTLSPDALDIKIIDNDKVDIEEMIDYDFVPSSTQVLTSSAISDDFYVTVDGSPQLQGNTIVFDGKVDGMNILNHDRINIGSHYPSKALAIKFKTGSDITRRQVLYEQGGDVSGLNIYIDEQRLYLGVHKIEDKNTPAETLKEVYLSHGIVKETEYNLVFDMSHGEKKLVRAWLNGFLIKKRHTMSPFSRHPDPIGVAKVAGKARFHDGPNHGQGFRFQGAIARIAGINTPMSPAQLISFRKLLPPTSPHIFAHQAISTVSEDRTKSVPVSLHLPYPLKQDTRFKIKLSGTALKDHDFTLPEKLEIPKGQSRISFDIKILNDNAAEFRESLFIKFESSSNLPVSSQIVLTINDDEGLKIVDQNAPWISFDEHSAIFHTRIHLDQIHQEAQDPSYTISHNSNYGAKFSDNQVLSFKNQYRKRRTSIFKEKTIALLIRTPNDTQTRQILYKQGSGERGINIYIDKGFIFFHIYNHKARRYYKDWGGHTLMGKIDQNKYYGVTFAFNSRKHRLVGLINDVYIENTQAKIGPLPLSRKRTIDFGGTKTPIKFHDGEVLSEGVSFKGQLLEAIFYNRSLNSKEMNHLSSYLRGRFIEAKFAGLP